MVMAETQDWYFEQDGGRQGPVPLESLLALLANKSVSADTLVWNASFGPVWKKLGEVQPPAIPTDTAGPPPLPQAKPKAGNFFAWTIALFPIIGSAVELVATADVGANAHRGITGILYFLAYSVLCALDAGQIRKGGATEAAPIFWFWLVPVYLYKRARALKQSLALLWVWIAALLVGLVMTETDLATGEMYWGVGLPGCESSTARSQVSGMFADVPLVSITGGTAVRIENIRELSSSDVERQCAATVLSSHSLRYAVTYKITASEDDFLFELQVEPPQ